MNKLICLSGPEIITSVSRPKDQNAAIVYLTSLPAQSGRRTMTCTLAIIAGWLGGSIETIDWGSLRFAHTVAIKTLILQNYAPATARKYLSALRGTLRAAWKLGQMSADDLGKATDLGRVTGESLPVGRYVSEDEMAKLFANCARDQNLVLGTRDAAILAVLYGCGLRRGELVSLSLADYDPEEGTLLVKGKGGKERKAYLTNEIAQAVADWKRLRGNYKGALFQPIYINGRIHRVYMTAQAVYKMIYTRILEVGLERFSPHSLRRSFVSRLLESGVDVISVSKLAGHGDPKTTKRYDRRPESALHAAAETMHVPYIRLDDRGYAPPPDVTDEGKTIIAITGQPDAHGRIFSLETLQKIVAEAPDLFWLDGNTLWGRKEGG